MKKDTGGPAFPCDRIPMTEGVICSDGMTLRDWFAGQALIGLLSDSNIKASQTDFAKNAYKLADAMLEARN